MAIPHPPPISQHERTTRSAVIVLHGTVENVFRLFGPVREKLWAEGWDPEILAGDGEVEEHMVFRTSPRYPDERHYLWIVSKYHPEKFFIEYTVVTSERVWFVTVSCAGSKGETHATISYSYSAWSSAAIQRNKDAARQMFAHELKDWEAAINEYLGKN